MIGSRGKSLFRTLTDSSNITLMFTYISSIPDFFKNVASTRAGLKYETSV